MGFNMTSPLVSICCLTYNQKNYIRQCLDSLLIQKTNFNFEILINDDASTDGTKEIILEYKKRYPDIIRTVLHRENQYSKGLRNFTTRYLYPKARGKYIALCEGDDYWTDPTKLQRQVDYLEAHKDYALCFHPVRVVYEGSNKEDIYPDTKPKLTTSELLKWNFIQTNSVLYRKQDYKSAAYDLMPADWYMHIYHAQFGKIGYIGRIMSVYRRHEGGIWSGVRENQAEFWSRFGYMHLVFFFRVLDIYENSQYKDIVLKNISNTVCEVFRYAKTKKEIMNQLGNTIPDAKDIVIESQAMNLQGLIKEIRYRDATITELLSVIKSKEAEINDIKSSRIWKLRNTIARFIGKKQV